MDKLIVTGGKKLKGTVRISGAKNSVLPIMAATLLTDEVCVIRNVPALRDVNTMLRILRQLGAKAEIENGVITIDPAGYRNHVAPYKLVSTMRASICVLGPILAKLGKAQVAHPGGCVIGPRPVDLHIKGLQALGAKVKVEHGYIMAQARRLKGGRVYLGGQFGSSVLATANVMTAAVLADGVTVIEHAACEPEISDLAEFLSKMGARIRGHGSHIIEVEGVKKLGGVEHAVIADRIEAGTLLTAAAITGSELVLAGACFEHLGAVIDKLTEAGTEIITDNGSIRVRGKRVLRPIDVTTLAYPGFPTDMQAQMMALMSVTPGVSVITEKVYPDRFMHISELNRMGAEINLEGATAIIKGVRRLSGAQVMASDLRASASLVLAGLVAEGDTEISRIYHLDRGYERLEDKLTAVGADIVRMKEER